MRRAARRVFRTISMGSLPGTMVVRNATRRRGSGRTGIGSRASAVATDSEITLIIRRPSTITIVPMTKMFAYMANGWFSSVSGRCAGSRSQMTNAISIAMFAVMISSERIHGPRPRDWCTPRNATR
jgi:hypothetical protein